ncbi:MAG: nuclear transport factor 2 family protein [Thioalkalispiraceae bacterium]|jgi:hypothetical protein
MRPLELANQYMEVIYGEKSPDLLKALLAKDCHFKGPWYEFNSAAEYIDSLKKDPPADFNYTLIDAFEGDNSACLVYQFKKKGISTPMTQVFEVMKGKISKILLIFDTAGFNKPNN